MLATSYVSLSVCLENEPQLKNTGTFVDTVGPHNTTDVHTVRCGQATRASWYIQQAKMAEAASVAKNLDQELQAVEDPMKVIRVVCRVKDHPGQLPSCIKKLTAESVTVWSLGNPNIAAGMSAKKRKHNISGPDITTQSNAYSFDRVYGTKTCLLYTSPSPRDRG